MNKKLKTSPAGRKCEHPDCEQTLSIYNHASYCRVHQAKQQASAMPKPYHHFNPK